jgi:hypothetical protein
MGYSNLDDYVDIAVLPVCALQDRTEQRSLGRLLVVAEPG